MLTILAVLFLTIPDVCPNLPGDQLQAPSGYEILEGLCVAADMVVVAPVEIPALPRDKPEVKLTVFPSLVTYFPSSRGVEFTITLTITNADENLWCPDLRWEMPNGTRPTWQADCKPFDEAEKDETEVKEIHQKTWTRQEHLNLTPGTHTILVGLFKANHKIKEKSVRIEVAGG